jgi:cytochrome c biogenesis protein CcmG/thiol:disulfide interchange protein DsbE
VRRVAAVLAALLLLAGCGGTDTKKQQDVQLPAVTLPAFDATGRATDLAHLKGPMVVNLWAQWCGPCRRDLPLYEQFHTAHPDVKVLGINWRESSHDKAVQLLAAKGVTYPSVVDKDGSVVRARVGLPNLLLVDRAGKVVYQGGLEITSLAQLEKLVEKYLGVSL